jgi:hypothetical protein
MRMIPKRHSRILWCNNTARNALLVSVRCSISSSESQCGGGLGDVVQGKIRKSS